jgi:eukaryotic-like serine/threonine-protein kinase
MVDAPPTTSIIRLAWDAPVVGAWPVAVIGKYRVRRKLGEGGMGAVLLADDPRGQAVVLKIPLRSTPEIVARMEDEATIGMQLRHAHIVKTLDFFMDEDRPVIVINHIEGTSLRELRDTVGALPPAMVARVGEQISDALSALHHLKDNTGRSLEILHRDVTPGNILVDRQGNACLIDLGIARSVLSTATKTSMGVLRGTFRYISPDLFRGGAYTWMTDLWALGVTLFEASVGRKAAEGTQHQVFHAIMEGHISGVRPGEQLHPALRYLFDGLLEVDAEARRFRDPEDVLHAFRVIRGRLGDGEAETIAVMEQVPIAMDEEAMEPTAVAHEPAPAPAPAMAPAPVSIPPTMPLAAPPKAPASATTRPSVPPLTDDSGDDFGEKTLVSAPSFDVVDSTGTVDTAVGPAGLPPPPRRQVSRTTSAEWAEPTVKAPKTRR